MRCSFYTMAQWKTRYTLQSDKWIDRTCPRGQTSKASHRLAAKSVESSLRARSNVHHLPVTDQCAQNLGFWGQKYLWAPTHLVGMLEVVEYTGFYGFWGSTATRRPERFFQLSPQLPLERPWEEGFPPSHAELHLDPQRQNFKRFDAKLQPPNKSLLALGIYKAHLQVIAMCLFRMLTAPKRRPGNRQTYKWCHMIWKKYWNTLWILTHLYYALKPGLLTWKANLRDLFEEAFWEV